GELARRLRLGALESGLVRFVAGPLRPGLERLDNQASGLGRRKLAGHGQGRRGEREHGEQCQRQPPPHVLITPALKAASKIWLRRIGSKSLGLPGSTFWLPIFLIAVSASTKPGTSTRMRSPSLTARATSCAGSKISPPEMFSGKP